MRCGMCMLFEMHVTHVTNAADGRIYATHLYIWYVYVDSRSRFYQPIATTRPAASLAKPPNWTDGTTTTGLNCQHANTRAFISFTWKKTTHAATYSNDRPRDPVGAASLRHPCGKLPYFRKCGSTDPTRLVEWQPGTFHTRPYKVCVLVFLMSRAPPPLESVACIGGSRHRKSGSLCESPKQRDNSSYLWWSLGRRRYNHPHPQI